MTEMEEVYMYVWLDARKHCPLSYYKATVRRQKNKRYSPASYYKGTIIIIDRNWDCGKEEEEEEEEEEEQKEEEEEEEGIRK